MSKDHSPYAGNMAGRAGSAMTPEQREKFCEENEVIVGPIYGESGTCGGWYAWASQKMVHAYANGRSDAIEMLAKMMEVMK